MDVKVQQPLPGGRGATPSWALPWKSPRGDTLVALVVFVLLTVVFFWPVARGRQTFISITFGMFSAGPYQYNRTQDNLEMDLLPHAAIGMPITRFAHHELAQGRLPLWCPDVGMGKPVSPNLIANLKNPLRWPLLIWPSARAFDLFILMRFVGGGWFLYLLLRACHLSRLAAYTGGVLHAFCPFFVDQVTLWHLYVDFLTPLLLLALLGVVRRPDFKRTVGLGVMAALVMLAGNPQPAILALGLTAILGLAAWGAALKTAKWRRLMASYVGAALIATGLALPEILDFRSWIGLCIHTHDEAAVTAALPFASSFSLLFSRMSFLSLGLHWDTPYVNRFACGFVAVALMAMAWPRRRDELTWLRRISLLVMTVFILKVFGGFGLVNWLGKLPVLKMIYWPKYCHLLYLAGFILAALGLENLRRGTWSWWTLGVVGGLIGAGVAIQAHDPARFSASFLILPGLRPYTGLMTTAGGLMILFSATAGGLMLLGRAPRRARQALLYLVPLAIFGEFHAYAPAKRERAFDPYKEPPFAGFLREEQRKRGEPSRVYGFSNVMHPWYGSVLGLQDIRDFDALYSKRYITLAASGFLTSLWENPYPATTSSVPAAAFNPMLDWCNVRYVISEGRLINAAPSYRDGSPALYRSVPLFAERKSLWIPVRAGPPGAASGRDEFHFTVRVPQAGARLRFYCSLHPWESESSDGVEFTVRAGGKAAEDVLIHGRQGHTPPDAPRTFYECDLGKWAGNEVFLSFQVEPGPRGDANGDVCGFGNLELLGSPAAGRDSRELRLIYDGEVCIYENTAALSRAFLVGDWRVAQDIGAAVDFIRSPTFDPRKCAIIEDPTGAQPAAPKTTTEPDFQGHVEITEYLPNTVQIRTNTARESLLVLADSYHPDWQCRIDGVKARVYPTNVGLRGVFVPAGQHRVVFIYRPVGLCIGYGSTAATCLLIIIFMVRNLRSRPSGDNPL